MGFHFGNFWVTKTSPSNPKIFYKQNCLYIFCLWAIFAKSGVMTYLVPKGILTPWHPPVDCPNCITHCVISLIWPSLFALQVCQNGKWKVHIFQKREQNCSNWTLCWYVAIKKGKGLGNLSIIKKATLKLISLSSSNATF